MHDREKMEVYIRRVVRRTHGPKAEGLNIGRSFACSCVGRTD
ncbi:MAG TPA: hypothetical protein VFM19_01490 [Candidatus Limnocylindria bacterium]|nr:hypothetical protein [Candidatus Limnocylindria bacterium]